MNDANEDLANPCVVVTMIAEMVRYVKVLFVRLDVVRMIIAPIICPVSINNVSIRVLVAQRVVQMLNAVVSIIKSNARVHHHLLVTPTLDVNSQQLSVANTTTVHQITLATETYAKLHAEAIKIACPMNDACVEYAEPFAIATLPVDKAKFAKVVYARLVVETIMCVQVIKRVSIINVPIHVQQLDSVEHAQSVLLSIMVFSAVVQPVSLEML